MSYNRIARNQEIRQAKAGYLPTIDAYAGAGLDRQHHPEFDTIWPQSATIGLRQNVFRFFGDQSEINRQEARANSQAFLLQGSAQNNALLAVKSYINVLKSEELFALAKENLVNHQRIFDQVKLRSESGIDRKADLDQVMGRLALAQSNIVAAKANLEDSNSDYQAVIGHLPGILVKPESAASALPATLEEAEKLAVDNHPTLMSSKLDIDARLAQHRTAKSQVFPSLDVAIDYKWQKDVDIAGRKEDFLAIASVSFNIFNGGWNKARIGQTCVEISEAREIFENVKRQTIHSVRLSWEANKAATERIVFLEDYVKAAGATAEAFNAQWNIGRRTMFDLLDTQAEYINARASLVTAKYDKLYAEYRVLNGTARLMQQLGVPLPGNSLVSMDN
jgi:adhesin transport system outer membrane protein